MISLTIPAKDFAYFDEDGGWTIESVDHELVVASSSDPAAENRLTATFSVN